MILTLTFITLKLIGAIAWSWAWVLSPMWMPIGILALAMLVYWIHQTLTGIAIRNGWKK